MSALTPTGNPGFEFGMLLVVLLVCLVSSKPRYLSALGLSRRRRFERFGDSGVSDIMASISSLLQTVQLTDTGIQTCLGISPISAAASCIASSALARCLISMLPFLTCYEQFC